MANKGKNKSTRWMRVFIDAYNLSGDARTFSSLDDAFDEVDLSGWNNSVRTYVKGQRAVGVRGLQLLANDGTGGAFSTLKEQGANRVSILFGGGAEPTFGDVAYLMEIQQLIDNLSLDGQASVINADLVSESGEDHLPWGIVLHPETSIGATTTGDTHDSGASSGNGWHANLHVTAQSSGDYEFKIEHSTNEVDWSTLGTFTIDGSTIGSEHLSGSGTVNQYVRFVATKTAGTLTPVATFARN